MSQKITKTLGLWNDKGVTIWKTYQNMGELRGSITRLTKAHVAGLNEGHISLHS